MTPIALDVAIGIILLISILIGYFRGIIKEVFTIAGLALAIFASYQLAHMLVPGINKWLDVPPEGSAQKTELFMGFLSPALAAKVIAYGGTFLLVFMITTLLGFLITHWVKEMGLGVVDRLLGAGFGFARGFLLVFLIYVPFTYLIDQKKMPEWAKNSVSVPILQKALEWSNKNFELDKKIEDRGNGIVIKFDKIDTDKLGKDAEKAIGNLSPAEQDLKESIRQEEEETQKGAEEVEPTPPPAVPSTEEQPLP